MNDELGKSKVRILLPQGESLDDYLKNIITWALGDKDAGNDEGTGQAETSADSP